MIMPITVQKCVKCEIRDYANHEATFFREISEILDYANHKAIFMEKSEIRNYATYGSKILDKKSEIRD